MAMMVPLPESVRRLTPQNTHPGLMLDKYVESWDPTVDTGKLSERVQKPTVEAVVKLSQSPPQGLDYSALLQRWRKIASAPGGLSFQAQTIGPLTLHLARASALENAGICLHPLYGFVYFPGSGLKGMARAYAETVWLPAQSDQQKAWRQIEDAFGWAPNPDRRRQINDPNHPAEARREDENDPHSPEIKASCGTIVFHDAWPESWPRLIVDIVNNHHPDYYQHDDNKHAPGDWENPVPVYFLAVAPGLTFTFALAKRRSDVPDELLAMAQQWLLGALCHLGAGAKTAAGYGAFKPAPSQNALPSPFRCMWNAALAGAQSEQFETKLRFRFASPPFLGGSDRNASETPRLSSVRGVLRSWWRAWHGHLTVAELREREATVFGSLAGGMALTLMPAGQQKLKILRAGENMGKGGSPLGYLGYGPIAYEKSAKANRTQLAAIEAGQAFDVRLIHRTQAGLEEVLKSAWLLGALGGIGARSRRGWGSVSLGGNWRALELPDLSACDTIEQYREALESGLERVAPAAQRKSAADTHWTAVTLDTRVVLSNTTFDSWREAMEDLGSRFQQFRTRDKRDKNLPGSDYEATKRLLTNQQPLPTSVPERAGFGVPYAQQYRSLKGARASFTPVWKDDHRTVEGRRASPLFCKIVELSGRKFLWQVVWLPAQFLPDNATIVGERTGSGAPRQLPNSPYPSPGPFGVERDPSDPKKTLLADFLNWLEGRKPFGGVSATPVPTAGPTPSGQSAPSGTPRASVGEMAQRPASAPKPVNQGQMRAGTIHQRPNGWVAVFEGDSRDAVITNPEKLPSDLKEGTAADFYVQSASKKGGIRARFERLR